MFTLVEAARQLAAEGALPVNVRFAFDGEEEVGGDSIVQWLERRRRPRRRGADPRRRNGLAGAADLLRRRARDALLPPPRPDGDDGHALGHVRGRRAQRHARLAWAHSRTSFRVPTATCPRSFAPARRHLPRRSSRPGRSSRPASEQLSHYGATQIAPGAADDFYLRTFASTSLDVNGIASGSPDLVKTVLPVEARANVSIRLAPGQEPEEIRAVVRAAASARGFPRAPSSRSRSRTRARPALTPTDAPAIQLAGDAFERSFGRRPLLVRTGGTLPIYAGLVARGLPTLATGFGIESECNVHAPNENMPEDAIDLGVATMREVFTQARRAWLVELPSRARSRRSWRATCSSGSSATSAWTRRRRTGRQARPSTREAARPLAHARRGAPRDRARRRRAERGLLGVRDACPARSTRPSSG